MSEHEQVNSKLITYEQLAENFHLPINEVSKKLGICTTVLKKVCRRNGIPRWPYRKLKAIDKKISNLKNSLQKNPQESKRIHAEIVALQEQKRLIMENPGCLSNVETNEQNFEEVYDDLNSSALLLSLTPSRDGDESGDGHSEPPTPSAFSSSTPIPRTEEEEEELMVALNLVELMSQAHSMKSEEPFKAPPRASEELQRAPAQSSSPCEPPPFHTAMPLFTSSHPPFSTASPPPSFTTSRPTSLSPPPFPNMPMINPRSFFSPEERAPPIPHSQPLSISPSPNPTPLRGSLRSFSSVPFLESVPVSDEPQPPLPSWFSRSLEEAVSENSPPRPETPSGQKRAAGRDVVTLEAESRTPTKRSRNQSPNFQALGGFPSMVPVPTSTSS